MTEAPADAVDALTEFVWIVGDPIAQVKAPQVMNPHYRAVGDNLLVLPTPVAAGDLGAVFDAARRLANVRGWIVTVPHKMQLAAMVDELSTAAQIAGAVNAVRFRDGRATGDLFDGAGFAASLIQRGRRIRGMSACVLGAGGVGSAIALALADNGAGRVTVHDPDSRRADALVGRLTRLGPAGTRFATGMPASLDGYDLLVNASPLGMSGDPRLPIDPALLRPSLAVAEVVMTPEVTPLLRAAQALGCEIHPGRQVLSGQLPLLLDYFR